MRTDIIPAVSVAEDATADVGDAIMSDRMARLHKARRDIISWRAKIVAKLTKLEIGLTLLPEDADLASSLRIRQVQWRVADEQAKALSACQAAQECRGVSWFGRKSRLIEQAARAVKDAADAVAELPLKVASERNSAQLLVERNVMHNAKNRKKVLGSLPHLLSRVDVLIDAIGKGDPAVATCLIRGKHEQAMRMADIWDMRRQGISVTDSMLQEYMSACAQRSILYEKQDVQASEELQRSRQDRIVQEGLRLLHMQAVGQAMEQAGMSPAAVTIVDAEWEEVVSDTSSHMRGDRNMLPPPENIVTNI